MIYNYFNIYDINKKKRLNVPPISIKLNIHQFDELNLSS